jgi:hypothetical protein
MDLSFGKTGILKYVFNRWHTFSEEIHTEFFEFSSGNGNVEVFSFSKGFTFNWSLMSR